MSEPIRDVETAVRERGALPVPTGTADLTAEQRAAIAELIGDAKPATGRLLEQLAQSVRDRREHEHPTWEDLFCLNLVSWAGERMAPVLRCLLDAEARAERYRTAWGMARSRAISTGGAADRYAARARDAQEALQHMLFTVIAGQMALKVATDEAAELRARLAEYERPADEDPIRYTLTAEAERLSFAERAARETSPARRQAWRMLAQAEESERNFDALRVPRPDAEDDVTPQVRKLRGILAGQREQVPGGDA